MIAGISLAGRVVVVTGASGAPLCATSQPTRVVLAPPIGTPIGTFAWAVTVSDPGGLTATVPFSVTIANAAPIANNDALTITVGPTKFAILANDTDPDGTTAGLRIQTIPSTLMFENGEAGTISVIQETNEILIDPRKGTGSATFSYTAVDSDGAVSNPAVVTVAVTTGNRPPSTIDQVIDIETGVAVTIPIIAADPDGDLLTVVELDDPAGVVVGVTGLNVTVLAPGQGSFVFAYRVTDGTNTSSSATITLQATISTTTSTTTTTISTTTTTVPPTTVPPTTVPPTTVPPTTVPPTTVPPTTVPPTTVPPTSVAGSTTQPPGG